MHKIINAIFLLIIGTTFVFFFRYLQTFDLIQSADISNKMFIPLSGTALFISLFHKTNYKSSIFWCLLFSLMVICVHFFFNNKSQTYKDIPIEKTFENINQFPQKKGVVIQDSINCISFGIMARVDEGIYLIENAFFHSHRKDEKDYSLLAKYAKITNNQLILYKTDILTDKQIINTAKNYETYISFDADLVFELWNERTSINLQKALPYLIYLKEFRKMMLLFTAEYLVCFIVILIMGALGLVAQNRGIFTKTSWIGILASYFTSYVVASLLLFYGLILLQTFINFHII
ncbi:MAG: hypothetical protein ACRCV0_05670 [Brevinema sp.]